ncbi:unnamed protein product [Ectocarpus sp. 12 AP-2014]
MGVFGRTLGWLKTAGASIWRMPVEIAQRHQDVVCLMLEENCSSSFLPSKMLGADEAAMFIITVVIMVLVKRWRRGGRFLEDQVCDENADEDEEDEEDAAAAAAAAREAAEEEVQLLESVNQEVLDQLEEEQRQRIVFEGAVEAQREGHRNQVAAMQRRRQAELASERQQHRENLDQAHELLATRNRDNEVLVEQAAAAERTVEEMRREREAAAMVATQLQEEQELAAVRLGEQNQAKLAAVREELATSDNEKAVWTQRATVAERQVEDMNREREAAAVTATQLQQEQQLAAVRLAEQNQARLAAVREELATSDNEKAVWTQRATVAERQVEEMRRWVYGCETEVKSLRCSLPVYKFQCIPQNLFESDLRPIFRSLGLSTSTHSPTHTSAASTFPSFICPDRAEEERAAIADTKFERLEKDVETAALRQGQLRAELDTMCVSIVYPHLDSTTLHRTTVGAKHRWDYAGRRVAEEAGQGETPTFNADVNETCATSSKVQQHRLAGYEEMAAHTKPLVEGVQAWSDKSVTITIDNCGNCYQSSWFLVTILWAVQCPQRLRELIIKLLRGYAQDGALVHVPPHYQVQFFSLSPCSRLPSETYWPEGEPLAGLGWQLLDILRYFLRHATKQLIAGLIRTKYSYGVLTLDFFSVVFPTYETTVNMCHFHHGGHNRRTGRRVCVRHCITPLPPPPRAPWPSHHIVAVRRGRVPFSHDHAEVLGVPHQLPRERRRSRRLRHQAGCTHRRDPPGRARFGNGDRRGRMQRGLPGASAEAGDGNRGSRVRRVVG